MSKLGFGLLIGFGSFVLLVFIAFIVIAGTRDHVIELEEHTQDAWVSISTTKTSANNQLELISEAIDESNERYIEVMTAIANARNSEDGPTAESVGVVIDLIVEAYPEGDANNADLYENYMNTIRLEANNLARYREAYNDAVKEYKVYTRKTFPSIILGIIGYEVVDYEYLIIPDDVSNGPLD